MRKRKECLPLEKDDHAFFQQFYEDNKGFIYYIAKKYTNNAADCEDLVQETIVRLIKNISSIRVLDRCKIAKYIVLTVRAVYLDGERRKNKEKLIFMDDESLEALMAEQLSVYGRDEQISAGQAVKELRAALSDRDWMLLEGKYILGLSQEELAEKIGVAPDSVRMVLHRARTKAKAILNVNAVKGGEINE